MSRPKKDIASRIFPALPFGMLKEVDEFIRAGVPPEGSRQAMRHERWWVDSTPFENLTKAREYVIEELQIPISDEIRIEYDYEPASGWKKKGQIMPPSKPQDLQIATRNFELAKQELDQFVAAGTNDAPQFSKLKSSLSYRRRMFEAAQKGMTFKEYTAWRVENKIPADRYSLPPAPAEVTQGSAAPETPASIPPQRTETREQEIRRHTKERNSFGVSITTAGGSNMKIDCVDLQSLDSVFLMVKKHGI